MISLPPPPLFSFLKECLLVCLVDTFPQLVFDIWFTIKFLVVLLWVLARVRSRVCVCLCVRVCVVDML